MLLFRRLSKTQVCIGQRRRKCSDVSKIVRQKESIVSLKLCRNLFSLKLLRSRRSRVNNFNLRGWWILYEIMSAVLMSAFSDRKMTELGIQITKEIFDVLKSSLSIILDLVSCLFLFSAYPNWF